MSIANKIKGLLASNGSNISKYAEYIGKTQPNVSNKIARNTWSIQDLMSLADHTGTRIAFINKDNIPVVIFDETDK